MIPTPESSLYFYRAEWERVVDGDTLDLVLDLGLGVLCKQRVRLYGIDTPETYGVKKDSEEYKAGAMATEYVKDCMESALELYVETIKDSTGKYGRYLARLWIVSASEEMYCLNERLVQEEMAERREY